MNFIDSVEAGKFMAFLVDKSFVGLINGCSNGTISIRQILDYIEVIFIRESIWKIKIMDERGVL